MLMFRGLMQMRIFLVIATGTIFKGSNRRKYSKRYINRWWKLAITGQESGRIRTLLIQNTIVAGMIPNVGIFLNVGLYFGNIIQFVDNTNGITYT